LERFSLWFLFRWEVSTFCGNMTNLSLVGRRILRLWASKTRWTFWLPFCAAEGMTCKHCMLARQKMNCFIHNGYEIHNCDSLLKYEVNINNIYKLGLYLSGNTMGSPL
jgi:hypothetical protein